MSIKQTDRVARANYRAKTKRITLDFYPTDEDIKTHLTQINANGETTPAYIKRLIRNDIKKEQE